MDINFKLICINTKEKDCIKYFFNVLLGSTANI